MKGNIKRPVNSLSVLTGDRLPATRKKPYVRASVCLQVILLIIPVILIYSNTLSSPFVLDDYPNIVKNRSIRLKDLSFENFIRAGLESPCERRPVANISFALNYFFHRYNLSGYHLVNIFIHIITGLSFYFLIRATLRIPLAQWPFISHKENAAHEWLPFFTALIWLVHPLHTQSVTYIVQRMNSLAAMFYVSSILLYSMARLDGNKRGRAILFACSLIAGVLAIGSKEIALTLPLILFLYEWFFFQQLNPAWLKKQAPFIIGTCLFIAVAVLAFSGLNPLQSIVGDYQGRHFTLSQRVLTEFRVVVHYLSLLLFPYPGRLNLEYDFPISFSLMNPVSTLFSLVFILGLIGFAVFSARKQRLISFGILWFFVNLLIESTVVDLELVFEHRTYLPTLFGILVFTAAAYKHITARGLRLLLLCTLAMVSSKWTFDRNAVWHDDISILTDCLKKSPDKERVHMNLGVAFSDKGHIDRALFHYYQALKIHRRFIKPENSETEETAARNTADDTREGLNIDLLNNLANALIRKGNVDAAEPYLLEIIKQAPENAIAYSNLGLARSKAGNREAAVRFYRKALRLDPDYAKARNNLGIELVFTGRAAEAIAQFSKAIELNPDYAEAHNNLGVRLASQGRFSEATTHFSKAIAARPDYYEAYYNLGIALSSRGRLEEAVLRFKQALTLRPDFIKAQKSYAEALSLRRRFERDLAGLKKEIALAPENPELYVRLGDLYKRNGNPKAAADQYLSATKIDPAHVFALKKLAVLYAMKGSYNDALVLFRRLVAVVPNDVDPYYKIASIYARQSKNEKAIKWLEKAVKRGYSDWNAINADKNLESIRKTSAFVKLKNRYNSK